MVLLVVVPPGLLLRWLRRPMTFATFLILVLLCGGGVYMAAHPLVTGALQGAEREVQRDSLTLWSLLLGAVVAILYQKRSTDAAAVRDLFRQWLEVQGLATVAALRITNLGGVRRNFVPDPEDPVWTQECIRRLTEATRDATAGLGACDRRVNTVARQLVGSLPAIERQMAAFRRTIIAYMTRVGTDPNFGEDGDAVIAAFHEPCERVNREFMRWLRL